MRDELLARADKWDALITFMGVITFASGALGLWFLLLAEVVPLRYYTMVIALISGGLGMIGIAQGLRLLLLILYKP